MFGPSTYFVNYTLLNILNYICAFNFNSILSNSIVSMKKKKKPLPEYLSTVL